METMPGRLFFNDIAVGRTFSSARRTLTETDIVNFAGLSGDFNPLHVDEVFARSSPFGRRIAHGMCAWSIATGLRSEIDDWALLGFLSCDRRFLAPVFAGDTIAVRGTVVNKRPSQSKPDRGVVTAEVELVNQDGEVVQAGTESYMVERRETKQDG